MELEVKGNKFFMLTKKGTKGKEIRLYDEMKAPINKIREYMAKGTIAEDMELLSIEVKEERFEIRVIPWSTIASELIKG